jgi:hypothetical protein
MNSLYQVFEPFGQVELVQLPLDPLTGLCKGFGFVQASVCLLSNSFVFVESSVWLTSVSSCSLHALKMQRLLRV